MNTVSAAYDTHKSFKRLIEAKIPEEQAEAIIDCLAGAQSDLATKTDLEAAIAKLEASTKGDMAKLENRLLRWMFGLAIGIVVSQTTLTVALIKLLP